MKYFRQFLNIIASDATIIASLVYLSVSFWDNNIARWPCILTLIRASMYMVLRHRKLVVNLDSKEASNGEPAKSIITPPLGYRISGVVNDKGELVQMTIYPDIRTFFGFDQ